MIPPTAAATWLSPEDCDLADLVALDLGADPARGLPVCAPTWSTASSSTSVSDRRRDVGSRRATAPAGRAHPRADRRARRRGVRGRLRRTAVLAAATRGVRASSSPRSAPSGAAAGDHFGKPGANDRIWNALQKLALHDPEVFAEYYANDILALVSQAWLGPRYQVTSQVNVVNPGGAAQAPHRDYHLGFVDADVGERVPRARAPLSPVLTLQGAVAHCDMPVESGPTMLLPHSQQFAARLRRLPAPEFVEYFAQHHVQLPLRKGDAVFFNPALFHGAGTNRPPTSAGWRTCCRSRRPSAGRWRPSTATRGRAPSTRPAGRSPRAGTPARVDNVVGRHRRGLRLPDQPRPRPADRRPRAAHPGRPRAPGARRGLGSRRPRASPRAAGRPDADDGRREPSCP